MERQNFPDVFKENSMLHEDASLFAPITKRQTATSISTFLIYLFVDFLIKLAVKSLNYDTH